MIKIIANGFGVLSTICFIISFQIKSNKGLFITQSIANVFYGLQFLLLGAYSGCVNLILGILRNLLMTQYGKRKWVRSKGWVAVFIAAFAAVLVLTWDGWTSLLPFAAMTTCTVAFWTDNALNIRKANLFVACPSWIIYDVVFHSWAGVLNETITIVSIMVSVWRFGWKNLGDPDSGFSQKKEE